MKKQPIALGFTEYSALAELHQRVNAGHHDYAIMLAGGLAISRKNIHFLSGRWVIFNEIDNTTQSLLDPDLWSQSNIGEALDKRALLDMDGDEGLIRVEGEGYVNADCWLAKVRSQMPANSDGLPDQILTDWYAGARLRPTKAGKIDSVRGWEAGDGAVAFSDIGFHEGDAVSHGQIVVYVVDHGNGNTYGCSAEITPDDAMKIGKFLTKWGRKERKG